MRNMLSIILLFSFAASSHDTGTVHSHTDNEGKEIELSRPRPGTLEQKRTKAAIEAKLINQLNEAFPETVFEREIDYEGWLEVASNVEEFIAEKSASNPQFIATMAAAKSLNNSLINLILEVRSSQLSPQEALDRLSNIQTFANTLDLPKSTDKLKTEARELFTTFVSYLVSSAKSIENKLLEPGFELLNRSKNPLWVLVVNDAAGLGKGKTVAEKEGTAKELEPEQSFSKKINIKKETRVLIFTKEPEEDIYQVVLNDQVELPCDIGYKITAGTGKTLYLSYSEEKGLSPQTGQLWGLRGKTRSGFSQANNVSQDQINKVSCEN